MTTADRLTRLIAHLRSGIAAADDLGPHLDGATASVAEVLRPAMQALLDTVLACATACASEADGDGLDAHRRHVCGLLARYDAAEGRVVEAVEQFGHAAALADQADDQPLVAVCVEFGRESEHVRDLLREHCATLADTLHRLRLAERAVDEGDEWRHHFEEGDR